MIPAAPLEAVVVFTCVFARVVLSDFAPPQIDRSRRPKPPMKPPHVGAKRRQTSVGR